MVGMETEASPAERFRALCDLRGEASVAAGCAEILRSDSWEDRELLAVLGGRHAVHEYERTEPAKSEQSYWAPTWAARGLLYAWADTVAPAVVGALGHEYWRVREMAAKVVAVREIGSAGDAVAALAGDPVARVRAAAARALRVVGEFEHASAALALAHDSDVQVRVRGEQAMAAMSARLDRDLANSDARSGLERLPGSDLAGDDPLGDEGHEGDGSGEQDNDRALPRPLAALGQVEGGNQIEHVQRAVDRPDDTDDPISSGAQAAVSEVLQRHPDQDQHDQSDADDDCDDSKPQEGSGLAGRDLRGPTG